MTEETRLQILQVAMVLFHDIEHPSKTEEAVRYDELITELTEYVETGEI